LTSLADAYRNKFLKPVVEDFLFDKVFDKIRYNNVRLITPNGISYARLIIFFVAAYVGVVFQAYLTAFSLMLASVIMDILDGSLARHWKMVSKLGAYLDPIADKVCIVFWIIYPSFWIQSATLTEPTILSVVAVSVTVAETILFTIAIIKLLIIDNPRSGLVVTKDGSNDYGKTKMVIESVAVLMTLLAMHFTINLDYLAPVFAASLGYAVLSINGHIKSIKKRA